MTRRKRGQRALPSGSPKSPRVLEADSAAADRRAPAAGEGPRNRAPSNQAQPQQQPQSPSLTTPRTPQRQVRSIASAAAATRRPSPPHLRLGVVPQLAARGPAAWSPASASAAWSWSLQHGFCTTSTPSRARAHSPSPPPGSRSSSASSGPSHMSMDSSGSVMPTYASVVRGPANQNSYANLSSRLLNFLKAE